MIEAVFLDFDGSLSIEISGHAGGNKGHDLVCAGVSSVVQMFEIGINGVLNLKKKLKRRMGIYLF
ncbi:MAG TPA: ribosomal-processing cysteine protease Prp [Spirochaetota bacterium]|nr:ribosomal-processing cysteine protease Prp [Spirochaetota bacterium]HPQ49553.1 ribosomal-processing cysteine protease Prp [Spirochaetota bacterium]